MKFYVFIFELNFCVEQNKNYMKFYDKVYISQKIIHYTIKSLNFNCTAVTRRQVLRLLHITFTDNIFTSGSQL